MRLWYGRWVSSYKNRDEVMFIDSDETKLLRGYLQLPSGHFTEEWYIISSGSYYKDNVKLVCPLNRWYEDHTSNIFIAFKKHKEKNNGS